MSEHDVPAGRGRDELRERLVTTLAALVALRDVVRDSGKLNGMEYDELGVQVNRAIAKAEAALLARQEAPSDKPVCPVCIERAQQEVAAGHHYSPDEVFAALDEDREPVCACGRTHPDGVWRIEPAAPQEAREPEVLTVEKPMTLTYPCGCVATYRLSETIRFCGANEHSPNALRGDAFVLLGAPAPEEATEREPEVLGYVVERQLTTGEWVRVWRGSTMWFDHDEAVLDRDAYALDGIPAHIRPVYLGAPASASGEPSGAVVREAPPISDTAVARIIEAVEAHCGMGRGAWDMVAARDLVEGFAAALGADTRRIDAIDSVLLPTAPGAPEEGAGE